MRSLRTNTKWNLATAAVWLAGFAAVASLVYALARPVEIRAEPASLSPRHPAITEISDDAAQTTAPAVERPTAVTLTHRARARPAAPRPAVTEHPRDISEMNCEGWRDLEMGSGRVQACE